jgi:hypothetical protein
MAEVIVEYDVELSGPDKNLYEARACGRLRADKLWEGWVEFVPLRGGATIRTARETTQPSRETLEYWATGLTDPYLDGALMRTLKPKPVAPRRHEITTRPAFEGPAEPVSFSQTAPVGAVLNPFDVYEEGDHILRQQLMALDEGHLRNIIRAHDLADLSPEELRAYTHSELVALIVSGVEQTVG